MTIAFDVAVKDKELKEFTLSDVIRTCGKVMTLVLTLEYVIGLKLGLCPSAISCTFLSAQLSERHFRYLLASRCHQSALRGPVNLLQMASMISKTLY